MYTEFFGLNSSPFHLSPDPYFMISSEKSKEALASISDAIRWRKGFVVMTGEVGTGKTLVLRCLFEQWDREQIPFAYFIGPRLSTTDFLSYITFELGIAVDEPTKGNLLRALYGFFLAQFEKGLTTVLIIDEAHQIPRSVLEEIRLLTNFETAQQKLVQIVLVGQPELDKKLDLAELRSLKQRIAARCHLEPLREEEIRNYIERRLELAGGDKQAPAIFPADAIKAIYRYSRGIPRLVNSICDQALIAAHARQIRVIPAEVIGEVASHFRLEPALAASQAEKASPFASQVERIVLDRPSEAVPPIAISVAETIAPEPEAPPMVAPVQAATTPDASLPAASMGTSLPDAPVPDTPAIEVAIPIAPVSPTSVQTSPVLITPVAAVRTMAAAAGIAAPVPMAMPSKTEISHETSLLRDGATTAQKKPDEAFSIASSIPRAISSAVPGAVPCADPGEALLSASARGSAPAPEPARPAGPTSQGRTLYPSFAKPAAPVADARTFFKSEQILGDSWLAQVRRWLQPGLRLALIVLAVVVVPVALAAGVFVARHQKGALAVQHKAVSAPVGLPVGQSVAPFQPAIQPAEASRVLQANMALLDPETPKASGGAPKTTAAPERATLSASHTNVVLRKLSTPVIQSHAVPAAIEPPLITGTQPTEAGLGAGSLGAFAVAPASPSARVVSQLQPPRLLSSFTPTYPSIALIANVQGAVLIDAVVDETGKVTDMTVISGHPVLNQAAMDALRKWKYAPARLNGQPARAHVQVRIDFSH